MKISETSFHLILLSGIVFLFINNLTSQETENSDIIPVSLSFVSEGSRVNGQFFPAHVNEPSPTVILLHGFPGGEGGLFDIGKKLVKEDINAYTFNYRGTWQSEGLFTAETSMEDVVESINFLTSPAICKKYNIDTTNISLVCYSYGTAIALLGVIQQPKVKKIISIGTSDLCVVAGFIRNSEGYRAGHQQFLDDAMNNPKIARGLGGKASHEWLLEHQDEYSLVNQADQLVDKSILFIAGWNDKTSALEDQTLPLYRALQKMGTENIKIKMYETDHSFGNVREDIFKDVLNWIK